MNCDPQSLMEAAKCYRCLPHSRLREAQVYLLCQWANNLTPPVVPFYFALDQALDLWIDTNGTHNAGNYTLAQFQAIADYPSVTRLTFITATNLTSISGLQNFPLLSRFDCGKLRSPILDFSGLFNLQIISTTTAFVHSELTSLTLNGCSALYQLWITSQSLASVDISDCPLLTNINLQSNLLTQTAVDNILHQLVLHGQTGGGVTLDGLTNAAPSAAGLADKAILEALVPPWTVTTN